MSREYIIPGSQNDTYTPPGTEINSEALHQASLTTAACLDTLRATCAKRMICGAFQSDSVMDTDKAIRGRIHISDIRCAAYACPSVIDNALNATEIVKL